MPSLPMGRTTCLRGWEEHFAALFIFFFPYKSGFYGRREVTDVSKSPCHPARLWERGFAAPERGHRRGDLYGSVPVVILPREEARSKLGNIHPWCKEPKTSLCFIWGARGEKNEVQQKSGKVPSGCRARSAPL